MPRRDIMRTITQGIIVSVLLGGFNRGRHPTSARRFVEARRFVMDSIAMRLVVF